MIRFLPRFTSWRELLRLIAGGVLLLASFSACTAPRAKPAASDGIGPVAEDAADAAGAAEAAAPAADVAADGTPSLSYLMTMSWAEAQAMSPTSVEIPPFFRVAAEAIEVLRHNPDGTPQRVRAKGRVFLEVMYREPARVLCQEAYVGDDEVIIRGKSMLQRGGSVVEGVDDRTVFYMLGTRLRVIGLHRVSNENELLQQIRRAELAHGGASSSGGGSGGGGGGFLQLPSNPPPLPVSQPWAGGPNPILPPLSPESVPDDVRSQMRKEAEAVDVVPLTPAGG
ncbi:MAG: hypothetical protein KDK99_17355 [Verrucomicrobiales bacterium]|nr:hypothetical protein [Verrucomicrobiales bacterium]